MDDKEVGVDFESIVMHYLAAQGLFLSPQISIRDGKGEWSCPDFAALDHEHRRVDVVEVTTAFDASGLIAKVEDREDHWIGRLRPQLEAADITDAAWTYRVRLFVRRDRLEYVKKRVGAAADVEVEAIEDIAFPWMWSWDTWMKQ